jgi:hypothetical protein
MVDRLNYRRLRIMLKEAASRAFDEVRRLHPDESFYVFGLHTSGEAAYAVPTANSEEGLKRRLARQWRRIWRQCCCLGGQQRKGVGPT